MNHIIFESFDSSLDEMEFSYFDKELNQYLLVVEIIFYELRINSLGVHSSSFVEVNEETLDYLVNIYDSEGSVDVELSKNEKNYLHEQVIKHLSEGTC